MPCGRLSTVGLRSLQPEGAHATMTIVNLKGENGTSST